MVRPGGALALVALLVCAGCKGRPSGTEAADKPDLVVLVRTARVERQTVRELVEAAGTVVPALGTEAQVAAQVTGTVVNVLKDEGRRWPRASPCSRSMPPSSGKRRAKPRR